jgi:hypothetical protein
MLRCLRYAELHISHKLFGDHHDYDLLAIVALWVTWRIPDVVREPCGGERGGRGRRAGWEAIKFMQSIREVNTV